MKNEYLRDYLFGSSLLGYWVSSVYVLLPRAKRYLSAYDVGSLMDVAFATTRIWHNVGFGAPVRGANNV